MGAHPCAQVATPRPVAAAHRRRVPSHAGRRARAGQHRDAGRRREQPVRRRLRPRAHAALGRRIRLAPHRARRVRGPGRLRGGVFAAPGARVRSAQRARPGGAHLALPPRGDRVDPPRRHPRVQRAVAAPSRGDGRQAGPGGGGEGGGGGEVNSLTAGVSAPAIKPTQPTHLSQRRETTRTVTPLPYRQHHRDRPTCRRGVTAAVRNQIYPVLAVTRNQITERSGDRYLNLTDHELLLPPILAELLSQLPCPRPRSTLPEPEMSTGLLFPGRTPNRPVDAGCPQIDLSSTGLTPAGVVTPPSSAWPRSSPPQCWRTRSRLMSPPRHVGRSTPNGTGTPTSQNAGFKRIRRTRRRRRTSAR